MRWSLLVLVFLASALCAQDKPEETLNAVVAVSAKIQPNARSAETLGMQRSGTGALVRDGYVLTIGYLVIEAEAIQVTGADGRTLPATLAAYDHASGLALLKVVGALGARPLPLGDSAALAEREPAMAVSAPARDSPTLVYVVSRRAFAGSWEYLLDSAIFTYPPVMEWSGAPLIGAKGELLGIGSLIVPDAGAPGDLGHAGISLSAGSLLTYMTGGFVTLALAVSVVLPLHVAAALAGLLTFVLPVTMIRRRGRQRLDLLSRQLPDALDLMARGLTVGHPLNTTVASVASDMKDPIATEFGILVDQVSYGDDLVDAFASFAERTDLEDVRYLAVSVGIQHGTGGNLAEVLKTLSSVIRDRMAMRRRIRAISAEGRLTSKFLSALPLIILGATSITAPTYYSGVAADPAFKPLAIVIAGLVISNYLIMRRLVDFRI